jgi:hypothetical protein
VRVWPATGTTRTCLSSQSGRPSQPSLARAAAGLAGVLPGLVGRRRSVPVGSAEMLC